MKLSCPDRLAGHAKATVPVGGLYSRLITRRYEVGRGDAVEWGRQMARGPELTVIVGVP